LKVWQLYSVDNPLPSKQIMLDVIFLQFTRATLLVKSQTGIDRSIKWLTAHTDLHFAIRALFLQKKPLITWPDRIWNNIYTDGIDWKGLGILTPAPITIVIWSEDKARSLASGGWVNDYWTALPTIALQKTGEYFGNPGYYVWDCAFDYMACHEIIHALSMWNKSITGISLEDTFPLDSGAPPQNHLDYCANVKNTPEIRAALEQLTAPGSI
jgi:hypothetical protein